MTRAITAVGNVADPATWSGIPFYFWRAAARAGFATEPVRLQLGWTKWLRRRWVIGRLLRGRFPVGYQYSTGFLDRAEAMIPRELLSEEVISFNQHFPRAATVRAAGGRISYYIDATFASLSAGRGLDLRLPSDVIVRGRDLECENYDLADRVVAMARWTADSVISDCGLTAERTYTVLPGANLELSEGWTPPPSPTGRPGIDRPFVLGFVGKDWKRKGLPIVCDVRDKLAKRGWNVIVRAAGKAPRELHSRPGVEFVGFIDKRDSDVAFANFLAGCDVGCLFSSHEALGISTLEFLRVGVPVAGYAIDGPADTLPPDAGLRFSIEDTLNHIADAFEAMLLDPSTYAALVANARTWSGLVTWDRCVRELQMVWQNRSVERPVCPWAGLVSEYVDS